MNLYRRFDELNWMQLGSNDPALQAGLGFVAHATFADAVSNVDELGCVAS